MRSGGHWRAWAGSPGVGELAQGPGAERGAQGWSAWIGGSCPRCPRRDGGCDSTSIPGNATALDPLSALPFKLLHSLNFLPSKPFLGTFSSQGDSKCWCWGAAELLQDPLERAQLRRVRLLPPKEQSPHGEKWQKFPSVF